MCNLISLCNTKAHCLLKLTIIVRLLDTPINNYFIFRNQLVHNINSLCIRVFRKVIILQGFPFCKIIIFGLSLTVHLDPLNVKQQARIVHNN